MSRKKSDIIFSILLIMQTDTWAAPESVIPKIPIQTDDLFEFVLPSGEGKSINVHMIKYKAKLYELAYDTYLKNKNVKNAYTVAAAAVAQNPNNRIWRSRLAQVAIWNEEPLIALKQYLYLVKHFADLDAEQKGLELSKKMSAYDALAEFLLFSIQHGDNSEKNWNDYIGLMIRIGEIDKLVDVLNANQRQLSEKFYLETFSKIYFINDEPLSQQKMLIALSNKIGVTPDIAVQLSAIYLNQENIAEAVRVMNKARKTASSTDYTFWETYARVAYLNNNAADELYAYEILVKQPNAGANIYLRLNELTVRARPELAYAYAVEGRKKFPTDYPLTLDAFSFIASQNQSMDFPKLLASIPGPIRAKLHNESSFWNARANYYKFLNVDSEVIQSYLTGMNYLPTSNELKNNLLLYLEEQNDLVGLRKVMPWWEASLINTPELWGAYAQGYAYLNDRLRARLTLSLFYDQFEKYKNNPNWLISFKDNLEDSFFEKAANEINHYAWPVYLSYLQGQDSAPDYEQLQNYVKLSLLDAPGDPTAAAFSILQNSENDDVELLLLTWAIQQENFSLARAVYLYYHTIGIEAPLWAKLSIMVERHDRRMEKQIIADKKTDVAYRDKVRAATDIEAIPLAQTTAYESLKLHRHDHDLYDNFFTPLMLRTADNFYLSPEFYQYGSVEGPLMNISYTYFLSPGISLTPYSSTWFSRNKPGGEVELDNGLNPVTNQLFATVPAHDQRLGIKVHTQQRRGTLDIDLGYRDNLDSFFTANALRTYPIYKDLNSTANLGYHQPADDTGGLLIGGMKNTLELGLVYELFAKDTLSGIYEQNIFYTQDGQYLADGGQATVRWEHKFWQTYPDWTLAPYGVVTQYYNKTDQLLHGNVLTLVPNGVIPDVNFMIPENSTEYGIALSFGQSYIDDYTHSWRPFASATLSQNSVVGIGKLYNAGMAGTLFGRDHLLLYYELGTNQGQGLQETRSIKMSYKIYR